MSEEEDDFANVYRVDIEVYPPVWNEYWDKHGDYVRYEDYEKLLKAYEALKKLHRPEGAKETEE